MPRNVKTDVFFVNVNSTPSIVKAFYGDFHIFLLSEFSFESLFSILFPLFSEFCTAASLGGKACSSFSPPPLRLDIICLVLVTLLNVKCVLSLMNNHLNI